MFDSATEAVSGFNKRLLPQTSPYQLLVAKSSSQCSVRHEYHYRLVVSKTLATQMKHIQTTRTSSIQGNGWATQIKKLTQSVCKHCYTSASYFVLCL